MLYNVTKIYVLNNDVLYVEEGEISRDSSNYNQIDVITNVSGFDVAIAFELPNGVYSDRLSLIQNTGTVTIPSSPSQLTPYEGEEWSSYTMLIPNAVLSAITSTTSQTLGFSLRFTKTINEGEQNEYTQAYTTEKETLSIQGTIGGEPVALDPAFYQNQVASEINTLIGLYNGLVSAITDSETGLAQKVNKSGDTMTGALQFSNLNSSLLIMGNNNITTDGQINATTFDNGDQVSDAIKFNDLASLFDVTVSTDPITANDNYLTRYTSALANKFAGILSEQDLNQIYVRLDGNDAMTGNLDLGNNDIVNLDGIASVKTELDGKVPSTRTVAGLALSADVSATQLKNAIGEATESLSGLLSSTDKATINTLTQLLTDDDGDTVVDTLQEILNIFAAYPEGTDIVTALAGKVDNADVGNRTYTEQNVVTNDESVTASIDALDIEVADKEDSANVGDRTYTNDYVVTDSETLTASIDALDTEAQRLEADKIDLDGENSSLTTLRYVHDDTDPNNIVYSTLTYDKDRQLLQYATPDGTTLQVGGELWFVNAKTNDALTHGDPVQFAGTQGDHFLVKKAVGGEIESNPDYFVGIATHDANANDFVKVTWFGEVSEIDTGSWSQGDILYFDKTTGGLVNTEPTTKPIIQVAAVTKVESAPSANDGRILIRPQFISRDAKEVFVDEVAGKYTADTLDGVLETLYDKTQTHEDLTNNPHQVTASQVNAIPTSEKGANNGVATLDSNGKVPIDQLPFALDDVLQGYYDNSTDAFYEEDTFTTVIPAAQDKLYIDLASNSLYRYDGSGYVAVIEVADVVNLGDIPDVNITGLQDNYILKYDSATSKWVVVNHTLDEINNVNVSGASNGQYLTFDGTNWVATTLPTFSTTLADLDDTTITTPANNDFLVHDGTDWKNRAISKTDVDLNNVQNYGIASQAEAETGTLDTKYMTPLKTKQSIEAATIDGGDF